MPDLTLFHSKTSVCSQKVRLVLAEKRLQYSSVLLDLTKGDQFAADYRKLNPNCTVPTLVAPPSTIQDSNAINLYLEGLHIGDPLLPGGSAGRAKCLGWMERSIALHSAINTITTLALKVDKLGALPADALALKLDQIPFPVRRQKLQNLIEHGVSAREYEVAQNTIAEFVEAMKTSLQNGSFLVGQQVSLADFSIFPFLYRLNILAFGGAFNRVPEITKWFDNMQLRKSFRVAVAPFHPPDLRAYYAQQGAKLRLMKPS